MSLSKKDLAKRKDILQCLADRGAAIFNSKVIVELKHGKKVLVRTIGKEKDNGDSLRRKETSRRTKGN